jgi:hypothetical protein
VTQRQVQSKDASLAKLHSQLLLDFDVDTIGGSGRNFEPNFSGRIRATEQNWISNCMQLLHAYDEASMVDSILDLQKRLQDTTSECTSLTEMVLHLQEKNAAFETQHASLEKKLREKDDMLAAAQSAYDEASQCQKELESFRLIFLRLGVSNSGEALYAVEMMQLNDRADAKALSERSETVEILSARVRELEQLVAIAAREYDILEEDTMNLSKRLKASDKKAALETRTAIMIQAFQIWVKKSAIGQSINNARQAADANKAELRRIVLQRIHRVWINRNLACAWRTWVMNHINKKKSRLKCIKVVAKIQKRLLQQVFNQLLTMCLQTKQQGRVCTKVVKKMLSSKLAKAFMAWCINAKNRNRQLALCSKVMKRMLSSKLAKAFMAWSINAENRNRQLALCSKVMKRMLSSNLAKAFTAWSINAENRNRQLALCSKVMKRMLSSKLAKAFTAWSINAENRNRQLALCSKVMKRMLSSKLAKAFMAWSINTKNIHRQTKVCTKAIKLIKYCMVGHAFRSWRTLALRVSQSKRASALLSLKSEHDAVVNLSTERSLELGTVQCQLKESEIFRRNFELDFAAKDAEFQIRQNQFEKLLQETNLRYQQQITDLQDQYQKLQNYTIETVDDCRHLEAHIIKIETESRQLQLDNVNLSNAADQHLLRINALLHDKEERNMLQVDKEKESEQAIADFQSKFKAISQSNRELLERNLEMSRRIQDYNNASLRLESEIVSLNDRVQQYHNQISAHVSFVTSIFHQASDFAIEHFQAKTLDQLADVIQAIFTTRTKALQVSSSFRDSVFARAHS